MEYCEYKNEHTEKINYLTEKHLSCSVKPEDCPYSNIMLTRRNIDQDNPTPICASKGLAKKAERLFTLTNKEFIPIKYNPETMENSSIREFLEKKELQPREKIN
ncbi:MAG: hypothetical protein WC812_00835 [Candidatus Pacearchaeota archaeon]|jgi:hypothetical protein